MISQSRYLSNLLKIFHMEDFKAAPFPFLSGIRLEEGGSTPLVDITLYRQLIGSLLYLTHLRPNISYVVSDTSRYMQNPNELHWKATQRILHYVQGTRDYGILYAAGAQLDVIDFTYSDWVGDGNDRKSTLGFVFMIGSGPICWSNKKQEALALSSAEAVYQGAVNVSIQAVWLHGILT